MSCDESCCEPDVLPVPVDFHTVENEEEILQAEFGDPDKNGVYGASGR